jgi:2-oxoglutarate dehydrogenase E2 component (dihydrolipoamide succinyltransferase)
MAINIVVPPLSESVIEATVVKWLKQEGDIVTPGEAVVELETEKANFEVAAEKGGFLVQIKRKAGEDVQVGDVLGVIEEALVKAGEETPKTKKEEAPKVEKETVEEREKVVLPTKEESLAQKRVTPVARRMAEEYNIDLEKIPASDPSNRVTKEDVESYLKRNKARQESVQYDISNVKPLHKEQPVEEEGKAEREAVSEPPVPWPIDRARREERVRMSRRRRTIARRLVEAQRTAAMLTTFNEVDMSAVMELRKRRKDSFKERYGVSLGINSFFVKAAIGALKDFPLLNAEIQDDEIVVKRYYDIGIAIGASEGLVVPVLRDADRMSFAEIEKAIKDFAERAEKGTLSLEELMGGTFTITNGGVFGSLMSTPILNPPQVGILGLHKIEERPVVINHEIVVRPMMYVALSYDHRIVDGREAVQFLVRVKELIEDPETLLLEG